MPRPLSVALSLLLVFAACSSPRDSTPAIRELYRESAQRHVRNPVIVVHGILGARLEDRVSAQTVWGAFTNDASDPSTPEGARALALPFADVEPGAMPDLSAAPVFATGPLEAIRLGLVFTVVNVGVYADILKALGVGGFRDPVAVDPASPAYADDHFTCFTFFYDWRRDNVDNAVAFGTYLKELRQRVARGAARRIEALRADGSPAALAEAGELEQWLQNGYRFDVVAHSMGGLIARYFLRYGAEPLPADGSLPAVTWAGAEDIDRLVCVGTPSLGSMDALQNLLNGFSPGLLLPTYDRAVLGTMTSIYQLLPRGEQLVVDEHGAPMQVDLLDPELWERNRWGLLDPASSEFLEWLLPDEPDAERRLAAARRALSNNLTRARRFGAALDQDAPPCPAELRLFAADTIPTLARVRLLDDDGRLVPDFDGDELFEFGDGTVTRRSTLADRRAPDGQQAWLDSPVPWSGVTFLPDDHVGLTKNPIFTDNLLFYLLEQPPPQR